MSTLAPSRRGFIMGCSAAIAAMSGATLSHLAFVDPVDAAGTESDTLIVIFLRGAWDALNVVMPIDGPDRGYYEAARPHIKIPTSGKNAALPLDGRFGFHPAMAPLWELYKQGHLGIVHAVGMTDATRSHFDAQQYIEAGTPGKRTTPSGWITRYLENMPTQSLLVPALATGGSVPLSLLGSTKVVAMTQPSDYRLPGDDTMGRLIHGLYEGDTWLHGAGRRALHSVDTLSRFGLHPYKPAPGVTYPDGQLTTALQTVAQLLKAGLTMRVATIDVGGWDTHQFEGDAGEGYFATLLGELAQGLAAFYTDLYAAHLSGRVTVLAISEFGRRLNQNESGGTDHGHGSVMLLLGGESIKGGKVYGNWPGLRNDQLFYRADLAVTTDYRQVISELLLNRMSAHNLDIIFPGFKPGTPLGLSRPLA